MWDTFLTVALWVFYMLCQVGFWAIVLALIGATLVWLEDMRKAAEERDALLKERAQWSEKHGD